MKVFVGYDTREDIAYQVCKHSILARSKDAEVIPLKQQELEMPVGTKDQLINLQVQNLHLHVSLFLS